MAAINKKQIIDVFLKKAFLSGRKFKRGSFCVYVDIGMGLGVKCYAIDSDSEVSNARNRNYAFRAQKELNGYGLAPKVYFKFDLHDPFFNIKVACYVTQHAQKVRSADKKNMHALIESLRSVGYDNTLDVCQRNCGVIRNKLVLIDCDYNSIS